MGSDIWIVMRWWGTLFLVGAVAFPLTKRIFSDWYDEGYLFAKAVGMALVAYLVYLTGSLRLLPFTTLSIAIALLLVFLGGFYRQFSDRKVTREYRKNQYLRTLLILILEETLFFGSMVFWAWVKGHEASIHGLEKFMDFGFTQSILNSRYFPPADMWYAGFSINYYYFGHMVLAVLTKLSAIDLSYTFNLMLAALFALTLTMSFSIGIEIYRNLHRTSFVFNAHGQMNHGEIKKEFYTLWEILAGFLTAFLVTLAGNLQTLYAFTKGYTGEDVKPFWKLFWKSSEFWSKLPEGLGKYWYANATRFIPFTIHEFPSYSFVVSDVHGHVLSIPFVLLAIALLVVIYGVFSNNSQAQFSIFNFQIIFYGFLVGVLLMTNTSDGPIYFGLLVTILLVVNWSNLINWANWRRLGGSIGLVAVAAFLTSLPFLSHFKSFVNGLAVNCPPAFLANSKIGPIIFESVDKCQKSPLWMLALLWGFFVYCGIWLVIKSLKFKVQSSKLWYRRLLVKTEFTQIEKLLIVFFLYSLGLIIFPEFFYFNDIYPAHFRSNTMFKLGYQAFILFSIVSGYVIVCMLARRAANHKRNFQFSIFNFQFRKRIFFLILIPQLFLVSIYPIFSVRSYFNILKEYKGLSGLEWLREQYPDDYEALLWLRDQNIKDENSSLPVIVEAEGDSYTDYARFSALSGLSTIVGWPVHEWLWRGSYDIVAPRREEVRAIYESGNLSYMQSILQKYNVSYVIVGTLEREKYQAMREDKMEMLGTPVFRSGNTLIYSVK